MPSPYYLNNINLKNVNVPISWTLEQTREYQKCLNDQIYFVKKYCKIVHVDKGLVNFDLWEFQENMINTFENNRFVICKMPRQVGKCFHMNTIVKVFDKKSKETYSVRIEELYERSKSNVVSNLSVENERSNIAHISKTNSSDLPRLSDQVERKFIDSIDLKDIDIWTDTGWKPASTIYKTIEYIEWELVTTSHSLTCADTHILFREDGSEVFCKDLVPGDYILTESGKEEVISITETNRVSNMYDIAVCSEDHRFYTNGILSHNTTTVAAYLLHKIIFNDTFSVAILANKDKQAREILSRIKMMFEYLPNWLQQGVVRWNEGDIELENGSKAIATATTGSSARGQTYNIVYLDEFAFVPNNLAESFFTSVYPTISSGKTTKTIITSTPKGMNYFYKLWKDSENGKNRYVRCEVHWSMIPGRDKAWQEETISNTSERQFNQEYNCEFLGSSNTLIDASKLSQLVYIEPIVTSGDVDMYEEVKKDHVYLISVDTSRGAGIDYSAFIVFDITEIPYKIVAKYRNNEISPLVYPTIIYNLAKHYNNAYVLVETNDIGGQVADILQHDLEYEHVLSTKVKGRNGQKVGGTMGGFRYTIGVRTTTSVKRIGCANFKSLVENDKLIINDYDLLYEMNRFVEHNAKYAAEDGEHDDLVMCCVLFSWLVHQEYFKLLSNNDARLEVLEYNKRLVDENVSPFGFIDDIWRDPEDIDFEDSSNWLN